MIDAISVVQLKAFARQGGVLLALLWLASFAAMLFCPRSSWGSMLAIATPFFVGWLLLRFRNYALKGVISFRRSFAFSALTFFYASMIFALAQYVYFRFLDHGVFMSQLITNVKILEDIYKQQGVSVAELNNGLTIMGQMSPIQLALMFMMQNILIGVVLSVPVALICKKKH